MKSILEIGLTGEFEDGKATITGKVCFESEKLEMIIWRLKSESGEFFLLREMQYKLDDENDDEEEDEEERVFEILSDVDPGDRRSFEELANEIFSDWKCFDDICVEAGLKTISSKGKTGDLPLNGTTIKMADIYYEDDEDDYDLEEDDVLLDYCIMWNNDSTWVFGLESLEEDEVAEYFNL